MKKDSLHILVAEDTTEVREMLCAQIHEELLQVIITQAVNGADAVKELKKGSFDLLICDWNLGDMTARQVLDNASSMKGKKMEASGICLTTTADAVLLPPTILWPGRAVEMNLSEDEQKHYHVISVVVKPFTDAIMHIIRDEFLAQQ